NNSNPSWIQSYYGARVVYRYNTFNYFKVDAHGTNGMIGTRWWEVYKNDFHNQSGGNAGGEGMNMRAGSGIIFGNTESGTMSPKPSIGLCEEDSGYPADYQIGRGTGGSGHEVLDPAYLWNNAQSVSVDACEAPETV